MKKPGLKTKLDFRFSVEDIDTPPWDFLISTPKTVESTTIRVIKKKGKRKPDKSSSKLF
jgi:hypothetical protein